MKPAISILVVDDEESLLETLVQLLELEGYFVNTAPDGRVAIEMLQTLPFDLVLLDIMMPNIGGIEVLKYTKDQLPETEVIMLTAIHDVKTAVDCMKSGAYYYLTKPYQGDEVLGLVQRAMERKRLALQNKALRRQIAQIELPPNVVGAGESFLAMMDVAVRAAPTDSVVLIQGPSGTGKELVARFIHERSARAGQPFLAVNCASIPETLLESELFGHERGAFTDAKTAKQGLVEITDGGTLFLDEVAELPLAVQPKLLRFLQSGEFRRVGGNKNLKSNVRIISATNRDLEQEVAQRRFSEDLYYRLNIVTLRAPALRDRRKDIPLLVEHFLKILAGAKDPKKLDSAALDLLMKHDWPGNIRELQNVIERAVMLSEDSTICIDDLALPVKTQSMRESVAADAGERKYAGSPISLDEIQRAHVEGVLNAVNWNKDLAAKILKISTRSLYEKIRTLHLKKPA